MHFNLEAVSSNYQNTLINYSGGRRSKCCKVSQRKRIEGESFDEQYVDFIAIFLSIRDLPTKNCKHKTFGNFWKFGLEQPKKNLET